MKIQAAVTRAAAMPMSLEILELAEPRDDEILVRLVATGIWNVTAVHYSAQDSAWKAVLMAKIVVVILAGVAVWLHQRATTKGQLALWGSVGGVASVAALVMGILLAG